MPSWLRDKFSDTLVQRNYFLAYCIGCLIGYLGFWMANIAPGFTLGGPGDLVGFYTGALIARSGDSHQLYSLAHQTHVQQDLLRGYGWVFKDGLQPFINPPFYAALLIPLTYLHLGIAFHVWNLFSLACLFAAIKILLNQQSRRGSADFLYTSLIVFSFFPVFETFFNAQNSFLILLGFAGAYVLLKKNRDGLAGGALALCLIKPQLLLAAGLVLIFKKRWRALSVLGVFAALLLALSWAMVGLRGLRDYMSLSQTALSWDGSYGFWPGRMANLRGTVYRVAHVLKMNGGTQPDSSTLMSSTFILSVILLCLVCLVWRGKWNPRSPVFDLQIAYTIVATMLLAPHLNGHDLNLLVLAGFAVFNAFSEIDGKVDKRKLIAAGHIAFLFSFFFGSVEGWPQIIMITLVAAMIYLHMEIRSRHRGQI